MPRLRQKLHGSQVSLRERLGQIGRGVQKGTDFLVGGGKLAEGMGKALAAKGTQPKLDKAQQTGFDIEGQLMERIKTKQAEGADVSRLEGALAQLREDQQQTAKAQQEIVEDLPSNREVIGSALRLAGSAAIPYVGAKAAAATGATTAVGKAAGAVAGAKAGAATSAFGGAVHGLGMGIEEEKGAADIAKQTVKEGIIGWAVGGVLGGAFGAYTGAKNSTVQAQLQRLQESPDSITLYRGQAEGSGGSHFTTDPKWTEHFGKEMVTGKLPQGSKIKTLTPSDMERAVNEGIFTEEDLYKKFFNEGFDAVVGTDSRNTNILDILVNPKHLETFSKVNPQAGSVAVSKLGVLAGVKGAAVGTAALGSKLLGDDGEGEAPTGLEQAANVIDAVEPEGPKEEKVVQIETVQEKEARENPPIQKEDLVFQEATVGDGLPYIKTDGETKSIKDVYKTYKPEPKREIKPFVVNDPQEGKFVVKDPEQLAIANEIAAVADNVAPEYTSYLLRLAAKEGVYNREAFRGEKENPGGGNDRGIFQINDKFFPTVTDEMANDVTFSTLWAISLIESGGESGGQGQKKWVANEAVLRSTIEDMIE